MPLNRVLCVRPTATTVESIRDVLSGGFDAEVETADSVDEARRLLDERSLDCLVGATDAVGFLIEAREERPDLHTVLLAEEGDAERVEEAYAAGIDEVIRNPGPAWIRALGPRLDDVTRGASSEAVDVDAHLRAVADTTPDVIVTINEDSVVEFVNPAIEDVLGYAPGEVVGRSLTELMSPELAERHEAGIRRYLETGERRVDWSDVEFPGRHREGHEVPLDISFTEFRHRGRQLFTGIVRDVTERTRREQELRRYGAMVEAVRDGVYALDSDGRFVAINDAYASMTGYDREELLGQPAAMVTGERIAEKARDLQAELAESESESVTLETELPRADGGTIPIEAHISLFPLDGAYGRVGVIRDVTERKRRERQLGALNETARRLTDAGTPEEVAAVVVEAAREALDLPVTEVLRYDQSTGRLRPAARTDAAAELAEESLFADERDIPWTIYAESDGAVYDDLSEEATVDGPMPIASAIVLSIGEHGVFVTGSTEPAAFEAGDVAMANGLVANARAALDRVDREQALRDRTETLAEQNETLERVNRLNAVIRDITGALTDATTREEIEEGVCSRLGNAEPYRFVWIGRSTGSGLEPWASAGVDEGYLDAIATDEGPAATALRSGEPAAWSDLRADPPFEPWRSQALRRSFRACVAVPLIYRETTYGALAVYADDPETFDELDVTVLEELGGMVGYAINALERKRALVSDRTVELEFTVPRTAVPLVAFVRETGGEFEFETLIERSDGALRLFFTVDGVVPDELDSFAEGATDVYDLNLIAERDGRYRYEATVDDDSLFGRMLAYGAYPKTLTTTRAETRLTVELPRNADVRSFIRAFVGVYEGAELIARRERDRPIQTEAEFCARYRDRLTERQAEVIRTAYHAGFFEWPREKSGQEIADLLGVSQPTVNRHIRAGERKLLELVFDEG